MNKEDFRKDDKGRTILGSAKEMAKWVNFRFKEQEEFRVGSDIGDNYRYIDLTNCVLYISYPIDSDNPNSQVFNLCDMADIVPFINKTTGENIYLFEVTYDIHFDKSVLCGNFFHYVHFRGDLWMNECEIQSTCSFFKVKVDGRFYAYNSSFYNFYIEESQFKHISLKGSIFKTRNIEFNYINVDEDLDLTSIKIEGNSKNDHYISLKDSQANNVIMSENKEISFNFKNSDFNNIRCYNITTNDILFSQCKIKETGLFLINNTDRNIKFKENNIIQNLTFWNCILTADIHIENSEMKEFHFCFSKITSDARLRLYKCLIDNCEIDESSIYGRLDLYENKCRIIDLDSTYSSGAILFENNIITEYKNRHTATLLKSEALKMNDNISYLNLYKEELKLYRKGIKETIGQAKYKNIRESIINKLNYGEEWSTLFLSKCSNNYGSSWLRAIVFILFVDTLLTAIIYFWGIEPSFFQTKVKDHIFKYISDLFLNMLNIFSVTNLSKAIECFHLNLLGKIVYIFAEIFIAYGAYQLISAFRKLNRK